MRVSSTLAGAEIEIFQRRSSNFHCGLVSYAFLMDGWAFSSLRAASSRINGRTLFRSRRRWLCLCPTHRTHPGVRVRRTPPKILHGLNGSN
eukprot:scaffold64_cov338-Pavlova_lutheri.AAC.33